jgi:nucleotide-binding universal stress UspA family protein
MGDPPEDETVELARHKLKQILAGAGTEGLEVEPIVRTMPAARVLIEHSQHSDLLVIGSRGRGGFRGLVMASVRCILCCTRITR